MQRRNFFRTLAFGGATVAFSPIAKATDQLKPAAAGAYLGIGCQHLTIHAPQRHLLLGCMVCAR